MDISEFKHRKQHNGFELEKVFNIQAEYSTSKEQKTLAVVSKKFFSTLRRKLLKINLKTNGTIINEEAIGHFYHPDLMLSENSYFIGCWQREIILSKFPIGLGMLIYVISFPVTG